MAWWFFLVLAAYLFIGLVSGDFAHSINSTVLTLLGISAGTAIGGVAVDVTKSGRSDQPAVVAAVAESIQARLAPLDTTIASLSAQLNATPGNVAAAQAKVAKVVEKEKLSSQLKKLRNESESFWLDILSDADGVSFHRFQIAAWTIVLGGIFAVSVYQNLAMPTFDPTLLTLLGISSGTYLGMKVAEPTVPTSPT
jgi:hypothetical protein